MSNKELKETYNRMHSKGVTAWFSNGEEERRTILKVGEPWKGLSVLEIGCGEGDLANMIRCQGANVHGIDYSEEAIKKANEKYPHILSVCIDFKNINLDVNPKYDRIVMQGVLEHLDKPFVDFKWIMDNLLEDKGDVITSSPCFLNTRGIIWMALDMLGAVMSKTDLHFIDPKDITEFCNINHYHSVCYDCDHSWGYGEDMYNDLRQRIPLALKDGGIPFKQEKLNQFLLWIKLNTHKYWAPCSGMVKFQYGATAVYKISKE